MSTKMYDRHTPYLAKIRDRVLLNGSGSTKKTYHLSLGVGDGLLDYRTGDSIGILPMNDPALVSEILERLQLNSEEVVMDARARGEVSVGSYLTHRANLSRISTSFFSRFTSEKIENLTTYLDSHHLIDLIELHSPRLSAQELCSGLLPLLPRFYSIASSKKVFPHEVHLLVSYVSYEFRGRQRFGAGSHFLCDVASIGKTPIPLYVQASNHFTLPEDSSAPIIFIGPGTGIAPFRAFIQERLAQQASGRNWLFFGERHRATDFYYEDFWLDLEREGHLQLDLAFSRDGASKYYVQHRMLEKKKELWNWLKEGSYLYVCGDAKEMAKDVDAALRQIAVEVGGLSEEKAREYFKQMRMEKRYLLDVY
jgi:sulfite reductase (NADPH) flavoprotein alpha-component